MKEINNLIVVEVPESALDDRWFIVFNDKLNSFQVEFQTNTDNIYVDLKKDKDCYILDKLSEISEKECSRFVEYKKHPVFTYNVYRKYQNSWCNSAKESLIGLLQSHGVDTDKNLLLIEKSDV